MVFCALMRSILPQQPGHQSSLRRGPIAAAIVMLSVLFATPLQAYDGPSFTKGLWVFQRSTEYVTHHWILPNARRVKVEQPVVRCVNPTEAMMETFRPTSIGACQSSAPIKQKNAFVFAKRCDYLGPVKTVITVESATAYRETNELLTGKSPKRDIVVARRVGDCGATADMGSTEVNGAVRDALAADLADSAADDVDLAISASRRQTYSSAGAPER